MYPDSQTLNDGILATDKPLLYGIINTANYDVMGYSFIAVDTPEGLENIGCLPDDIDRADGLEVGGTFSSLNWPAENAIIIIKLKDDRKKITV